MVGIVWNFYYARTLHTPIIYENVNKFEPFLERLLQKTKK